jgi:hypothetical protein
MLLTILGEICRCGVPSCAICLRTCMSDSVPSPRLPGVLNLLLDSIPLPLSPNNKHTSSMRRRRPHDEDGDHMLKTKEVDDGRTGPGCGQVVCRTCCFEHPQRYEPIKHSVDLFANMQNLFAINNSGVVACLDCSAKQGVLQTHDSDASTPGVLSPDHKLIASS